MLLAFAGFCACQRVSVALTSAQQADTDDQIIRAYLASKNFGSYIRTNAGNYVVIDTAHPENPYLRSGNFAYIRYRGFSPGLEGYAFDSNTVTANTLPFRVEIGTPNSVIAGWQDGLRYFRNQESGYLFIPSGQGYGAAGSSSGSIGPNQVLVFHMQVVNVQ